MSFRLTVHLTLKAPSKICSRRHSIFFFREKSLDISCESSAKQTIHMKCQYLFSLKNKNKKMSSAAVVVCALRLKNAKNYTMPQICRKWWRIEKKYNYHKFYPDRKWALLLEKGPYDILVRDQLMNRSVWSGSSLFVNILYSTVTKGSLANNKDPEHTSAHRLV